MLVATLKITCKLQLIFQLWKWRITWGILVVSLSFSESPASYCGGKRPWGCLQRALFQSVFSSSVLPAHSTSCLFKHLFYHSATPASQKQPEPFYSKKTEIQRQAVRAHSVKLFIFSVSVQRKKRTIFAVFNFLTRALLLRRHSLRSRIKWSNLFTAVFSPPSSLHQRRFSL